MKDKTNIFESASVPRAVAQMAVPTILSMLVVVIYNMADTFFVGQTGDANQVAAVSLTMPIFLILMAFGNMFGIGGGSMISRLLGANEPERAKTVSSFCFYASIVVGVAAGAVTVLAINPILHVIGAGENTFAFAHDYLFFIALGAPAVIVSNAFANIVRAEGAATVSMAGNMAGTVVNIVLDPIMILGLGWGVKGAAIATVIGNLCSAVFYIVYLLSRKTVLSVSPKRCKVRGDIVSGVVSIGLPASLNNVLMSVSNILLNIFLVSYGDTQVAAMGIAMKANMLVIFVQLGLAMGIQPLIGYSYGAKNVERLHKVVKFSVVCTIVLGAALTGLYLAASAQIVNVFIADEAVVTAGVPMLRALMLSGPVVGILFVLTNALQAMGRAAASMALSISRQGIVFIPCLFAFNALFQMDGIIFAQPVADIVSIVFAVALYIRITRKLARTLENGESLAAQTA